jgi:DNA phosphorothioation-associated DGQHR protein 1
MKPYREYFALKVVQPLGVFYMAMIPASDLESLSYAARAKYKKGGVFNKVFSPIEGTQRDADVKREKEIARYINTSESALPNTVILGANIETDGSLVDGRSRWYVEEISSGIYKLIVPTGKQLASVIDGQHRLNGCLRSERPDFELACAIYLDIPAPYHAYLFATINANQKKVDRSLAYDLYGFGLENEGRNEWSPEKFGVYLVRCLAIESGLKGKILLGAQVQDEIKGVVSLAAMVDSIISLISSNPKKDRDDILYHKNSKGRKILEASGFNLPFRQAFIDGKDNYIEESVLFFVDAICSRVIPHQPENSFISKTVGFQSLFDYLKKKLQLSKCTYDKVAIDSDLDALSKIDFSTSFYTASGMGRSRIKNSIFLKLGMIKLSDLEHSRDFKHYKKFFPEP